MFFLSNFFTMVKASDRFESIHQKDYRARRPEDYLATIQPEILKSFSSQQLQAITEVLDAAIPKPSPKIVDLRFGVDLIVSRFYVVLFVGKERRRHPRRYIPEKVSRAGNAIATIILLLGLNLFISLLVLLSLRLVQSVVGFNGFPQESPGDQLLP